VFRRMLEHKAEKPITVVLVNDSIAREEELLTTLCRHPAMKLVEGREYFSGPVDVIIAAMLAIRNDEDAYRFPPPMAPDNLAIAKGKIPYPLTSEFVTAKFATLYKSLLLSISDLAEVITTFIFVGNVRVAGGVLEHYDGIRWAANGLAYVIRGPLQRALQLEVEQAHPPSWCDSHQGISDDDLNLRFERTKCANCCRYARKLTWLRTRVCPLTLGAADPDHFVDKLLNGISARLV
jgi:hypothetical protein